MALALNLRIEHDILSTNATLLKEVHFLKVGHAVSAIHAGVVGDRHEFALGLCPVTCTCGHEFCTEGHVSAFGTEGVVIGSKIWPSHGPNIGVVKPAHQFRHPIEGRDGVVIGEEHQIMVHLAERKVARIGAVTAWVVDPRGAVFFTNGLGVVFGFGIGYDNLEMRVGLLAQSAKDDVEFIGVVDGRNQHGRFVRRTVFLEENRDRFSLAHETVHTSAS